MTAPFRLMLGLLLFIQIATITGYTDHDAGMDGLGVTASGRRTGPGIIAAGPGVPFGSVVCLIGGECYEVWDRGGCIVDVGVASAPGCAVVSNFDVWLADRDAALELGRQERLVIVIEVEP